MYKLSPEADISGTEDLTMSEFPPICLTERFGKAPYTDGHKVSGEHIFTSDRGDVFTVHDWKQTTLFHGEDSGAPTPEEFWHSKELKFLRIAGRAGGNANPFIKWLLG